MEHGIIRDWNDMERIWHYIFSKEQLQTVSEEVLIDVLRYQPQSQCVLKTPAILTVAICCQHVVP